MLSATTVESEICWRAGKTVRRASRVAGWLPLALRAEEVNLRVSTGDAEADGGSSSVCRDVEATGDVATASGGRNIGS